MASEGSGRGGRREAILQAALRRFTRYGYRRTSMDEIAREADISRAALYLHFDNKEALFRELSESVHEQILAGAEAAASAEGTLDARLFRVLEAKLVRFHELLKSSEHGEELIDENNRLGGEISTRSKQRFRQLLAQILRRADAAGEIALVAAGLKPDRAADLVLSAAMGIEAAAEDLTPALYRRQLAQMLRVLVAGLGGAGETKRQPTRAGSARGRVAKGRAGTAAS
jgi:AcrR family transcriptional regulator